jgi:hypothetical protein
VGKIRLHGPGVLCEIVGQAIEQCTQDSQKCNYYVLVVMTVGKIIDLEKLKNIILQTSQIPLSIMIVGVGSADFEDIINLSLFIIIGFRSAISSRNSKRNIRCSNSSNSMISLIRNACSKEKSFLSFLISFYNT